jgi:6-phosphogluconolactonase
MNDYTLKLFESLEALSQWAAQFMIENAQEAVSARGRFLLVLNGGGTPRRVFELLGTTYVDKMDWAKTHIFWGDERCVAADDPESNFRQAWDLFLSRASIPEGNIHRVKTELRPPDAAKDYALLLKRFASPGHDWPFFDLIFLGMGEDGHTASLFPGSPADPTEPVLAVIGNYQDRPANRVTLTPIVFNDARSIMFMASGDGKAPTLARVLGDDYDPEKYPAQRIHPKNGKLIWLVDRAAAKLLSQK